MGRKDHSTLISDRMRSAGLPGRLIEDFVARYRQWAGGWSGKVGWHEVEPPRAGDIVDLAATVDAACTQRGAALLDQLVCIKLNGGLGTTMKLSTTKSLIPVRQGRSFLQLVVDQVLRLREDHGSQTPLLLMNSYRTRADSLAHLGSSLIQPAGLPIDFLQHKVPRVDVDTGAPLEVGEEAQRWAPPGHGDVYLALWLGGMLDRLLAAGFRWAFVSNVDNLAATVEPGLLGYLDAEGIDFAMEVTDKTRADIKGGTLVRRGGRLALLERAQVSDDHLADFEDIGQLPVFNTNSLWWRIEALKRKLDQHTLEMPTIVNPKRVAGRDVVQLEVAMGAAIGCFERALGVRVPRRRFAPVKGTVDLVAVRSDAYELDGAGGLRLCPERAVDLGPPVVRLDPRFYQGVDQLARRCPHPLSLLRCRSLTIEGEVILGRDVRFEGDVTLRNCGDGARTVADGQCFTTGVYEL